MGKKKNSGDSSLLVLIFGGIAALVAILYFGGDPSEENGKSRILSNHHTESTAQSSKNKEEGNSRSKEEEKQIKELIKEGNYRELCRINEFESAHRVLDELYNEYVNSDRETGPTNRAKYLDALDYIFNKEALYLFSLEDEQANKRITYLLTEIPVRGTCPSDGAECGLNVNEFGFMQIEQDVAWAKYYSFVTDYNSKCTQLLDLAIANDNKNIAKKLLAMYKEDIEVENRLIELKGVMPYHKDFYKISTKTKDAAKVKYEKAFGKD